MIIVVGVKGKGKKKKIGKIEEKIKEGGMKVMMEEGDKLREEEIEKINIWGERKG